MAARHLIDFARNHRGEPYEVAHFLIAAVANYDEHELNRVKTFNVQLARHIIRRRLVHWTTHGWGGGSKIPGDAELFAQFARLVLARDDPKLRTKCQEEVGRGKDPIPEDKLVPQDVDQKFLRAPGMFNSSRGERR